MEIKKSKLSCSFCGKKQSQVKKLIAGPNIYICNECVDLCNDILVEEEKSEVDQSFQIAKPKEIRFGDNLPKTRSGKIMRRLLRSLAKGEEIKQDISTLENPAILKQLS